MRDAGIKNYLLFSRKNNTCSRALSKINYCDACRNYLSLDTDKMYLLSTQLLLKLVNRHTLHFKVGSENTFCTLFKKLMEANTLTYHFDKIFLMYGARQPLKQFLSLLQCKHGGWTKAKRKSLHFSVFLFKRKVSQKILTLSNE